MPNVALSGEPVRKGVAHSLRAGRLGLGLRFNPGIERLQLLRLDPDPNEGAGLLRPRLALQFHVITS